MESIIGFLVFFGAVFILVLLAMLAFMKLAHRRIEPDPNEKRTKEGYMDGAPSELHGSEKPGCDPRGHT